VDSTNAPLLLLIEDEPQMRRFLRAALGAQDYRLVEATSAREGLALAASRNPDVILLDLGLPDRDGLEVTRELRGWSPVPIIVLSARGREQDKVAALDLGAEPSNLLLEAPAFFALFFVLAIGEEVGWTDYAIDPLLDRWGPLTTAVILGLVTSLWHIGPLVNMGRTGEWIAWWILWSAPQRILFVWIYTGTGRSLFAAILLHTSVNLSVSSPFLPRHGTYLDLAVAGAVTAVAAALVGTRLRSVGPVSP
jgi:CheY-like chemotaxis protein